MKIFTKKKLPSGRRHIYLFGLKVLSYKHKKRAERCFFNPDLNKNILYLSFAEGGGLGDCLMDIPFLQQIAKQSPCKIVFDVYSRFPFVFDGLDFISHNYKYSSDFKEIPLKNYDVSFQIMRFGKPFNVNYEKIKRLYPKLLNYIEKSQEMINRGLSQFNLVDQYAFIHGKKRFQQFDIHDIFAVKDSFRLKTSKNAQKILSKFGLDNKKFFLINRDVDSCFAGIHPKLWDMKNYEKLVKLLKKEFPNMPVIQVGANDRFGIIKGTDQSLIGKTDFEELEVLLKNAEYLISSEGGLNHLTHFVGGRSVVLFGPTDSKIFGYSENINIQGVGCPAPCCWVVNNWSSGCLLGKNRCHCMQAITPEFIIEKIKGEK